MTTATAAAYLARIRLNPHSRDVQRDLRDHTQLHKTLMRLIPDDIGPNPRQQTGLLFRIDTTEYATTLLVQATHPLDPARLPNGYGHTEIKDLGPMFRALRAGLGVRYRIAVNPSKAQRLPLEQNRRGKVTPLYGPDADQWWERRARDAGLSLQTLNASPLAPVTRGDAPDRIRHRLVRYEGSATVTDPEPLTAAVLTGIGRGKPYGAGLLSLAPATTA